MLKWAQEDPEWDAEILDVQIHNAEGQRDLLLQLQDAVNGGDEAEADRIWEAIGVEETRAFEEESALIESREAEWDTETNRTTLLYDAPLRRARCGVCGLDDRNVGLGK